MQDTKKAIIEATIDIVAEEGLEGFSVSKLSKQVGIAKGTIYCHFSSKEELLYQCFLLINHEIASLFLNKDLPKFTSKEDIYQLLHDQWIRYFEFMIDNGNKSLFFYAYRDSENLERVLMKNNETVANEMEDFNNYIGGAFSLTGIFRKIPADYLWVYILDGTGIYVKHILRKHIKRDEVQVETIWKLLFSGMKGYM